MGHADFIILLTGPVAQCHKLDNYSKSTKSFKFAFLWRICRLLLAHGNNHIICNIMTKKQFFVTDFLHALRGLSVLVM